MRMIQVISLAAAVLGAATPAPAAIPAPVAGVDAAGPRQFYVLSFTDTPIAEVAEDVVGGALGGSVAVDPAVTGAMSFRAEGWFSPDDLLQEFGAALLDQEVALVRSRQGDLALVPRANLGSELAAGGAVVTIPQTFAARPVQPAAPLPAIVYGRDRWQDGPLGLLLMFLAGCGAGVAAVLGGQTLGRRIEVRRRSVAVPPMLSLTYDPVIAQDPSVIEDPGLVIPCFRDASRKP